MPEPVAPTMPTRSPGLHLEADVLEHALGLVVGVAVVGEPHVVEDDVAAPPAPAARPGCAGELDRDRLVEQREDPLGRGHRRLQDVELLRHVADRPEEPLRVLQERHERAERQRARAARRRRRTR